MNAWRTKKTFADVAKEVGGCILIAIMWIGMWMMFVII